MFVCGAFTNGGKYEIKERAGNKSELSGLEHDPEFLICAHLNHDRDNPLYDHPDNGMRITKIEEFVYHSRNRFQPTEIGLTSELNDRAIRTWEELLPQVYLHLTRQELEDQICIAHDHWVEWEAKKYWEKHRQKNFRNNSYIPPAF